MEKKTRCINKGTMSVPLMCDGTIGAKEVPIMFGFFGVVVAILRYYYG